MRFLTSLTVALCAAGTIPASAQIVLFGDARLGLGYNIVNNGGLDTTATTDANGALIPDNELRGAEDLRAVSRVRFGVRMSGETDSGISFGATIRADNAGGGQGGTAGQRGGSVFLSGSYGRLTFGDTNGADEHRVRNIELTTGRIGLTGFNDFDDTYFGSNGNDTGSDRQGFVRNGDNNGRPTARYDFDFTSVPVGLSLSTNRDLNSFALGARYTLELDAGTIDLGLGYADITGYTAAAGNLVPDYEQYSVGLTGAFGGFTGAAFYLYTDGDDDARLEQLTLGLSYAFGAVRVNGFYSDLIEARGDTSFGLVGSGDFYGAGARYDLGGGASLVGGVAEDSAGNTMADFGVDLRF